MVIQAILKQGLANYFEFDPTLVRVAYVLLTVCTAFSGTLAYLLLWFVMPKQEAEKQQCHTKPHSSHTPHKAPPPAPPP